MAKVILKIVALLFVYNICYSQQKDTIVIKYNKPLYLKIAKDSTKYKYERQKEYIAENKIQNHPDLMVNKILYDDISYFSIPIYRISKYALEEYDCEKSIGNFIVFNEYIKFQRALLINKKNKVIAPSSIPNGDYCNDFMNNPSYLTSLQEKHIIARYQTFFYYAENVFEAYEKTYLDKDNFYFEIYGLYPVLFEIELATGKMYAIGLGDFYPEVKLPADEFIRKYVGEKYIKDLAKGDVMNIEDISKCTDTNINDKNEIYFKVKYINPDGTR
jgi:hypothetical protein